MLVKLFILKITKTQMMERQATCNNTVMLILHSLPPVGQAVSYLGSAKSLGSSCFVGVGFFANLFYFGLVVLSGWLFGVCFFGFGGFLWGGLLFVLCFP